MRRAQRKAGRSARAILCCLALALLATTAGAESEADDSRAANLKAAYLRYIAEFTTWPEGTFVDRDAPIVIGVLEEDVSGVIASLERRIESKGLTAQKRRLELRMLKPGASLAGQLDGCHLLFVPAAQESHWKGLQRLLVARSIVTISDISGFARTEGMIEFVVASDDNRVNMHIDLVPVRNARLKLSSRLLGLKQGVKIVRTPDEGQA